MLIPTYGNAGSHDVTPQSAVRVEWFQKAEGMVLIFIILANNLPYTPQQWLGLIGVA